MLTVVEQYEITALLRGTMKNMWTRETAVHGLRAVRREAEKKKAGDKKREREILRANETAGILQRRR